MTTPLRLQIDNLSNWARSGRLAAIQERDQELSRLKRILGRPNRHHALVVGPPGIGKTALIEAFALEVAGGNSHVFEPFYRFVVDPLRMFLDRGGSLAAIYPALDQLAGQLTGGILWIDDLDLLFTDEPTRVTIARQILEPFLQQKNLRLIVTMTPANQRIWTNQAIDQNFEILLLHELSAEALKTVLRSTIASQSPFAQISISDEVLDHVIRLDRSRPSHQANPGRLLRLFEEAALEAAHDQRPDLTRSDIDLVLGDATTRIAGLQKTLNEEELNQRFNEAVIGQSRVMNYLTETMLRIQLNLTDPNRPRASFLFLGPSGVGKTETAKVLADLIYQQPQALVRLDMSEFSEAQASARLIGAPPGYVGYREGGQLTNPVAERPTSLVLLDEIEKAHPRLFDLFLQVLDDGRLTDGLGQTINFSETMVIATSNIGAIEIIQASQRGVDVHHPHFLRDQLFPKLLERFRPEFLNRFDAILVFEPLGLDQLVSLARRELDRLAQRVSDRAVQFQVSDEELRDMIRRVTHPLLGARPVRRLIQQEFETALARQLLADRTSPTITIEWRPV